MATSNVVETVLKLRGSREFQAQAKDSAKSLLGIGEAGEKGGKRAAAGWKGVAKWAGGAAAIGGTMAYMKGAVSETEALAKSTMGLSRITGMDTKAASEWAAVLKVRGIDTAKFSIGMVTLSKQMVAASKGNEKAAGAFDTMGVSMDAVKAGDTSAVISQMADGFAGMENPAQKAAFAAQLLGRQGQALLPMLNSGSAALNDQLKMASDYGASLDGNATDAVKRQIAAQREWDMAMLGLKVQLGTGVVPALAAFATALAKIVKFLQPLIRNSTLLQGVVIGLTAAFVTFKVVTFAASVAALGLNAAVLLIPLAIVAIVVGLVVLYKKWGWFHRLVDATFKWVKGHWQLVGGILLGPIVVAVAVIVKNFGKIKAAIKGVWSFAKEWFGKIAGLVKGLFSGEIVRDMGRGLADWLNRVTPFGDRIKVGPLDFTLPALADGGTMMRSGLALVGERGPEVVALPARSTVYPNPGVAPLSAPPSLDGSAGQTIVTKVYLDRRQIAEAVGTYAADKRARR